MILRFDIFTTIKIKYSLQKINKPQITLKGQKLEKTKSK